MPSASVISAETITEFEDVGAIGKFDIYYLRCRIAEDEVFVPKTFNVSSFIRQVPPLASAE